MYRGELVWNKTKKRDVEGRTAVTTRPEAEWLRVDRPDLRIIADDVWHAAQSKRQSIRTRHATTHGRVHRDVDSKYLLSGFARCATCGGSLSTLSREHGQRRVFFYGRLAHHKRGATVCDNALIIPIERVDAAVLDKIGEVLRPAVVKAIIAEVFKALAPAQVASNVGALRHDLRALDRKIANLTAAVEHGAALAPLVAKLTARQSERDALVAALGAADALAQQQLDRHTTTAQVLAQVAKWRALLTTDIVDGRQLLREVLDGPLQFAPDGQQYRFSGADKVGTLVARLVGVPPLLASPAGFEPAFWP